MSVSLRRSLCVNDKIKAKVSDLLKELTDEDFKFNFCDFLKSLVSDKKNNKVYKLENKNLNDCMDISTYLQLKQEVDLLKELLLDKDQ